MKQISSSSEKVILTIHKGTFKQIAGIVSNPKYLNLSFYHINNTLKVEILHSKYSKLFNY